MHIHNSLTYYIWLALDNTFEQLSGIIFGNSKLIASNFLKHSSCILKYPHSNSTLFLFCFPEFAHFLTYSYIYQDDNELVSSSHLL